MTIVKHELKQGRTAFFIWTGAIALLLAICLLLFPEMKGQMDQVSDMFSSMGAFTSAFGMDRLNFGTLSGYYAIECGNVLGLGGAFFASLCAGGMLCKEEQGKTAEFLLTHPLSRRRIMTEKLGAVFIQILAMNLIIFGVALGCMAAIGESIPLKEVGLLHLGYFLMQMELACLAFGLSSFLRKNSAGVSLGMTVILYFLNLIANITENARFLKYITAFGYCDGADIISRGSLDGKMLASGLILALAGLLAAYLYYPRKDIR